MATGGFLVAGVARWDSSLPHILTEQETESWQELRPGYRRHFPKVTQPSKIAKATGWRPSKSTHGTKEDISLSNHNSFATFLCGVFPLTKSICLIYQEKIIKVELCVI